MVSNMILFRMKGSIGDLLHKIEILQNSSWIDNRTRAVVTEFSVYNAQVNGRRSNPTKKIIKIKN